ncbi:MAG TPA: mechanosensitive ion channel domain-containing protein [Candidatus Wunengus sp. YC61]|uniref:mechanosensitive ion channel domain-containing protein n=1 Tax=Candidatus Wunengus sp. YC61 TaxID=3367698 RepID=UPI00402995DC
MKYVMLKKRITFPCTLFSGSGFLLYLSVCVLWIVFLCSPVHAQSLEKLVTFSEKGKDEGVTLTEIGLTVKAEDVENARNKADEVKASVDKSVSEIESFISNLQNDAETTDAYLEKLQQEKKAYQAGAINPEFLEVLDKELGIVKQKVDVDNEQIQAYKDQITALQNQAKIYADRIMLLDSVMKMSDTLAVIPSDQLSTIKKEADIAKGFITAVQAGLREKETLVSHFIKELEDVKVRLSVKEQDLTKNLESLKAKIPEEALMKVAQEKITGIVAWEKTINTQWVAIFGKKLETAKIRYDEAVQALKNAELNSTFLAEKARRLEERIKAEELKKKQAELEAAKKAEEVTQKVAEVTRAEAEKTIQETARKTEEIAQEQMVTTSPEKKRVLELEAEVHKQIGLVAKKKDELITIGAQRYKDVTEHRKLEAEVEDLINKGAASKDVEESLKKVESEIKRFSEAITALESLIPSVKQEEELVSDNLSMAYEGISKIEKEVTLFEDKELAGKATEYARHITKTLEEQSGLISARLDRLYERLETKKNALTLLDKTKENLNNMKAANVWTRLRSTISTKTFIVLYKDIAGSYTRLDYLFNAVQLHTKDFITYVAQNKHTLIFWVKLCGIALLAMGCYLTKRRIRRLCAKKAVEFFEYEESSDYKKRLFYSLFIILQKSIFAILLTILAVLVAVFFDLKIPAVKATIQVLIYIATYRVFKGFLIEAFSPEKGDKKLFTSLAYVSPKHLYQSLSIILLFSLVLLSIISVLTIFQYKNDVLELLWFIYRVGILILLLWLATQKTLIFKLLPDAESQLGKLINRIITIMYPIFIVFIVVLFAVRSLGYAILTYVLLKTCIKSFAIAFIAFCVWKFLLYRLNYVRERQLQRNNIKKGTTAEEEKKFRSLTQIYQTSFNYVVSILTAIIIIRVWFGTFRDALGSPAAPYLIQKTVGQIGAILSAFGSGLRYRFVFEEGKYTTPLKIIIALIVLIVSFFIARHTKTLLDKKVFYKLRFDRGARYTLSTMARYAIIGIAILIGLNIAGIPLRSLAIFAGAFGIGIGFGMQNIISNFISGIILLIERPMHVGDVIVLEDSALGTVEKINARSTTIITPDGITMTVPNSKFIETKITNLTHPAPQIRGCAKVGVAYGSNTALVKKCLLEIVKQNPNVRTYPEPFVRFAEFGESALIFELYFWAEDPGKRWFTQSELNFAIDEVFQKNNIEIAFPQRDIHIRSIAPFPDHTVQKHLQQEDNK